MQLKAVYIACFATALVYTNRSLAALLLLLLLLCLPAVANLYIVVSQDAMTVAVVLEMRACVGRDNYIACSYHRGITFIVLLSLLCT